jgi:hypothetical protein
MEQRRFARLEEGLVVEADTYGLSRGFRHHALQPQPVEQDSGHNATYDLLSSRDHYLYAMGRRYSSCISIGLHV